MKYEEISHEKHENMAKEFASLLKSLSSIQDEIHLKFKSYTREYTAIDTVLRKARAVEGMMQENWEDSHCNLRRGDPLEKEINPYILKGEDNADM